MRGLYRATTAWRRTSARGPGGTRTPSAPDAPVLPPELNLPDRLSVRGDSRPRDLPTPSQPLATPTNVARLVPPASGQPVLPKPAEPPGPTSPPGRLVVKRCCRTPAIG